MPRYDYQCTSCGQVLEVTQKMSDPPLTDCNCGKQGTLQRLLSAGSGLIFKGSGFYITDYKGGSGAGASASSSAASSSATATESKADSKPAAGGHSCGSGCGCH